MREYSRSSIWKRLDVLRPSIVTVGLLGLLGVGLFGNGLSAAEVPRLVPASLHDVVERNRMQTAVLAGGCFWGVQGVFQHVEGVISATSGYAGGSAEAATYEQTESGRTSHAEAVQIVFDPRIVSYGKLLQIFFSAAHDPTQINRQGADIGTQYRSAIFPADEEQALVAADYVRQLDAAKTFKIRIATTIEPRRTFYRAEAYHQDFMYNNPVHPYIISAEKPKIESLKKFFPQVYRAKPVLVVNNRD